MEKFLAKLEKLKKLSDQSSAPKRQSSVTTTTTPSKTPTTSGDNRHRMTEKEEDEELMLNDTNDLENEDEVITRFDASPWCKYPRSTQLFVPNSFAPPIPSTQTSRTERCATTKSAASTG